MSSGIFATVVMIMAVRGNTKHKSSVAMAIGRGNSEASVQCSGGADWFGSGGE